MFMFVYHQASWVDKMMQRVRNVIKKANKAARSSGLPTADTPSTKRLKNDKQKMAIVNRYPLNNQQQQGIDDITSLESQLKEIQVEMKKGNPRDSVLLPLMKSTIK